MTHESLYLNELSSSWTVLDPLDYENYNHPAVYNVVADYAIDMQTTQDGWILTKVD